MPNLTTSFFGPMYSKMECIWDYGFRAVLMICALCVTSFASAAGGLSHRAARSTHAVPGLVYACIAPAPFMSGLAVGAGESGGLAGSCSEDEAVSVLAPFSGQDTSLAEPRAMPFDDGVLFDASQSRPLGGSFHFSVQLNQNVDAAVVLLSAAAGPATIFGLVIPVIVDSVQRPFWRRLTHVSREVSVVVPSLADLDPSAAVVEEKGVSGVIAALTHALPYAIAPELGMAIHVLARDPRGTALTGKLIPQAAARLDVPRGQVIDADHFPRTAVALTEPPRSRGALFFAQDSQAAIFKTGRDRVHA